MRRKRTGLIKAELERQTEKALELIQRHQKEVENLKQALLSLEQLQNGPDNWTPDDASKLADVQMITRDAQWRQWG